MSMPTLTSAETSTFTCPRSGSFSSRANPIRRLSRTQPSSSLAHPLASLFPTSFMFSGETKPTAGSNPCSQSPLPRSPIDSTSPHTTRQPTQVCWTVDISGRMTHALALRHALTVPRQIYSTFRFHRGTRRGSCKESEHERDLKGNRCFPRSSSG